MNYQKSVFASLALASALANLPSAQAATCSRWTTQCTNSCTQMDEYGTCLKWTQDCTQVCSEWSNPSIATESLTSLVTDAELQLAFAKVATIYPSNAKQMTWHFGANREIIIDEVQK